MREMMHELSSQNKEIKEQNEEIKERVGDLEHKLDYVTDGYVVPPKDIMKTEACVVMKNP
jgi:hypothetical protein